MPLLKNFKLILEYDGTAFCGWQIQSQGERTIQGEVQKVLYQIYKKKINVIASGRTDAGVHASGQVIHFKVKTRMTGHEVQKAMNAFLPPDIVVLKAQEAKLDFHAQFSVKSKTYRYVILNRPYPSAHLRNFCHYFPQKLSLFRMRQGASFLMGRKDFKSFEATDHKRPKHSTVRCIKNITIKKKSDWISIDITADGFLYKMVRNIVGVLLDMGGGKLTVKELALILEKKDRRTAKETAEPQGLCLIKVEY